MKKYIGLIGYKNISYTEKEYLVEYGIYLESPYEFDTLIEKLKDTSETDFIIRAVPTNWGGEDEIKRILEIKRLSLTGRKFDLINPLTFAGTDSDMGHIYKWSVVVKEILECEEE